MSHRFDEVDAIVVFDDVLVPWENVLFYRHTRAAHFLRETLHRYSAFTFLQRSLKLADMLIGTALHNAIRPIPAAASSCSNAVRSSTCRTSTTCTGTCRR
ncbi:hypothetical protein [Staphylococcus aureus]|uniref:hypothetical protein n=1 Tax=Staphylococcus aureus TaxID=1280 RepID=UPI0020A26702|nr:hypothetical protein [Staphylococcus aureus]